MSFLANLFTKAKNLASATLKVDNDDTEVEVEGGWDFVSAEEAAGFYPDRITLFLGPHLETRHHILLVDIPSTSTLLKYIATLEPAHQYMHLTALDIPMVMSYEELVGVSVDALVKDTSWIDIVTLAITAEVLQDSVVERKAIDALKLKAALADKTSTPSFSHKDVALARKYQLKTGAGKRLMQTLEELASRGAAKSCASKLQEAGEWSKPQAVDEGVKYGKSVLRGKGLGSVKKAGEGEGKEYPRRQPSIPPSVEALRSGTVQGFAWPDKQGTVEK
jgi:hypothetical protein